MDRNLDMTKGSPLKLLLLFSIPLMFGNVFQQLYTVIDTAIVGQGVGLEALAALGTVDWLNWMFVGMAQGFTQGFGVRVSQFYGKKNFERLKEYVGQSLSLSILIGILFTIIAHVCLPLFLKLLRVPSELISMATLYIRIIFSGFLIVMLFNYFASVLRGIGDSKTPLQAMLIASVVNIILDILFVFSFKWGISGAAIATLIAQVISCFICALKVMNTKEVCIDISYMKSISLYDDLITLSTPMALKNVIIALGGIYVQSVANGFDLSFIAGYTATNKLFGILEMAAGAYGFAITTYVGQNYGANERNRIKEGMKSSVLLSFITSLVISLIMILFGKNIVLLFISSDTIELMNLAMNYAYTFLTIMSIFLPFLYLLYAYQAALQGLGNTKISIMTGLIELSIRLCIATYAGYMFMETGIFFAEVLAWVGSFIYLSITYYKTVKNSL